MILRSGSPGPRDNHPSLGLSAAERGANGLILTDKRLIYKKYAANREFGLEKGGKRHIEGSESTAAIEISQAGEREAMLRSDLQAASSLACALTELQLPWQVSGKMHDG